MDAHPNGIASRASMMPGKFTYEELLSYIEQSKRLVAEAAAKGAAMDGRVKTLGEVLAHVSVNHLIALGNLRSVY